MIVKYDTIQYNTIQYILPPVLCPPVLCPPVSFLHFRPFYSEKSENIVQTLYIVQCTKHKTHQTVQNRILLQVMYCTVYYITVQLLVVKFSSYNPCIGLLLSFPWYPVVPFHLVVHTMGITPPFLPLLLPLPPAPLPPLALPLPQHLYSIVQYSTV